MNTIVIKREISYSNSKARKEKIIESPIPHAKVMEAMGNQKKEPLASQLF